MKQLALFEHEVVASDPSTDVDGVALIYTCAQSGKTSSVRLIVNAEDASAICSDPATSGQAHGNHWMAMFTSLSNYLNCHGGSTSIRVEDDGRFRPLLDRLGITPIATTDPRVARFIEVKR